jgi:hypothetical protein
LDIQELLRAIEYSSRLRPAWKRHDFRLAAHILVLALEAFSGHERPNLVFSELKER